MECTKSKKSPKDTYFIHVKIFKYEDRTVSILADHKLYRRQTIKKERRVKFVISIYIYIYI